MLARLLLDDYMIRKKRDRSLTLHQRERIVAIQKRRADSLAARSDAQLQSLTNAILGEDEEGLVIAHFGLNVEVEDSKGVRFRCAVRKSVAEEPVCGDRVMWMRAGDEQGVIGGIQKRSSVLQRPLSYRRLQIIAANVEQIFIVTVATDPNFGLLDRYLVAAGVAGIDAVIVVNKVDLVDNMETLMAQFAHYGRMGYRLIFTSIISLTGLTDLIQALAGRISVFVGKSGTGKSSLAAQWISAPSLKIGRINLERGKGRHTTTVASLYHLPRGGSLIDSPGIREFGLYAVSADVVGRYFLDIVEFVGQCRFSDCQHADEPLCAVQRAVQSGQIHPARLESLRQIQISLVREKLF